MRRRAYARSVQKQGVALVDIEGFPAAAVERLRDEVSVTTADEFADIARRMAPKLQAMLEIDDDSFARLRQLAEVAATVGDAPDSTDRLRTGMDPPSGGRDTYSG